MDQKSQLKVIKAGFKIIHKDDSPEFRIKIRDGYCPNWRFVAKHFKSKEERDNFFNRMLVSNIFIYD